MSSNVTPTPTVDNEPIQSGDHGTEKGKQKVVQHSNVGEAHLRRVKRPKKAFHWEYLLRVQTDSLIAVQQRRNARRPVDVEPYTKPLHLHERQERFDNQEHARVVMRGLPQCWKHNKTDDEVPVETSVTKRHHQRNTAHTASYMKAIPAMYSTMELDCEGHVAHSVFPRRPALILQRLHSVPWNPSCVPPVRLLQVTWHMTLTHIPCILPAWLVRRQATQRQKFVPETHLHLALRDNQQDQGRGVGGTFRDRRPKHLSCMCSDQALAGMNKHDMAAHQT